MQTERGELEFFQAFIKRGFVNIPRLLFDYTADLGLDYDTIGKIFALLALLGGSQESAFGSYTISRRLHPRDFDQAHQLIQDLEQKDIVRSELVGDKVLFSLIPLFSRLRAIWNQYRERVEEEVAAAADPVLMTAQRLLGRPLSDREVTDIQDWTDSYGYESDMIQAIIKEGQHQGITRMSYLKQVARQWFEEGIRTPEEAELYVQRYRKAAGKHKVIIQHLGVKRQLTLAEQALLDRWTEEWAFSNEVIIRACTEAAGSNNPLQYVNRVLESWLERGLRTVTEVESFLIEHKRRPGGPGKGAQGVGAQRREKGASRSNVFLHREKKDEQNYDHIYKKFSD